MTLKGEKRINELLPKLQEALTEGWIKFSKNSPSPIGFNHYERLQALYESSKDNWYKGLNNGKITNPQHMELARLIGEEFVGLCAKNGISLGESFPGIFRQSVELGHPDPQENDARRFVLPVYVDGKLVGEFQLDFIHTHDSFGFTEPPQLKFYPKSHVLSLADSSPQWQR